jgi:hypothetical protein
MVYFKPKENFGTESKLEAKLEDKKWTFFFHMYDMNFSIIQLTL